MFLLNLEFKFIGCGYCCDVYVWHILNDQLKTYPDIYEGYVPMAYDDYLEKMSKYFSTLFSLLNYLF